MTANHVYVNLQQKVIFINWREKQVENKMKKQYLILQVCMVIILVFFGIVFIYAGVTAQGENPWVMIVGGPGFLALGVFFICRIATLDCLHLIKDYLKLHPETTMEVVENDFKISTKLGPRVWVGIRWTFYLDAAGIPNLFDTNEIIWAYFDVEWKGRSRNGYIYIFNIKREMTKVPIAKRNSKKVLRLYDENYSHIVIGYSQDLYKMFWNDFDKFLDIRYQNNYVGIR